MVSELEREKKFYKWPRGTKKALLLRDGKGCVVCLSQMGLVIHHYWERMDSPTFMSPYFENVNGDWQPKFDLKCLVLLCRSCHGKAHSSDRHSPFMELLYRIMDEKRKRARREEKESG